MNRSKIDELLRWMGDGASPFSDGRTIVSHLCERLNAAGVPVDLFRLFLFTLHPLIGGRRLQWKAETGAIISDAPHQLFRTVEYFDNPLPHVIKTRQSLRRRLIDPDCPGDFKVIGELRADGFTDYLVQPVIYIDGEVHTMSWSSRHPDGFSDDAIAALERLRGPLSRLVESYLLRINAANILSTYVGRGAGEQVLQGHIKRGDAENIRAAILFADLKGFTAMSNSETAQVVMERLNAFYDALEAAIRAHHGEILKFMGDGLLAIFPVGKRGGDQEVVAQGLAAMREARVALAEAQSGYRAALHFGELAYGNIGAGRRLDFTAIGPAVNLCARLLEAASRLGCDDVCSATVNDMAGERFGLAGHVELKGFAGETPVHLVA